MSNEPSEKLNYGTFNEDYSNSSCIVATNVSGGITFVSWYNIILLEHYPTNTTKLSGPRIFELDIGKLHQCQLEISNESITSRKRLLSLIQSKFRQSKHFTTFEKDSEQTLTSLMLKYNMVTKTGQLHSPAK
ncbi:7092_t:CDS:2, partial [Diversispora eburnea]